VDVVQPCLFQHFTPRAEDRHGMAARLCDLLLPIFQVDIPDRRMLVAGSLHKGAAVIRQVVPRHGRQAEVIDRDLVECPPTQDRNQKRHAKTDRNTPGVPFEKPHEQGKQRADVDIDNPGQRHHGRDDACGDTVRRPWTILQGADQTRD